MAAAGRESEEQRLARKAQKDTKEARKKDREEREARGETVAPEEEQESDEDELLEMEEGSKKDIMRMFNKSRSGKREYSRQVLVEEVQEITERMEQAAEKDVDALAKEEPEPAVYKAMMLPEVLNFMRKRHLHEVMIDLGFLTTLAKWLQPTADGALVNMTVRTGLLKALQLIEADDALVGALRTSKIGVYVKLLSMHRKETDDNKRMARGLVEKWSRPIFGSSASFRAQDVEEVMPKYDARELSAQVETDVAKDIQQNPNAYAEREVKSSGMVTAKGTVVPRPLGMDFHAQPASSAKPMASNKYTKDGSKGKLVERFTNSKKAKAGQRQAATLSVEGRTIDRV